MSNDMNKTVREFYKAVEGVKTKKGGGYDTQATVRRIEDGVAWVHIPDGVDETPARMTISAKVGDVVQVRIVNGRAFLVGNASAPPTDNTEAVKAMGQAGLAAEAASIARQKADEAVEDAATAHEAAMIAKDSADAAQASADAAQTSADNAQTSATTANQAANSALAGLGTVESVLDVVTWFSEHKTATTDTTVQAGKSYYEYDASTGVLTKVDPEGTENPSEEGWYELDEAITNYVSTHLAQTNDGLNVVSSINGWRVLISSGGGNYNAGVYLIDPNENIAQSTTAAGVVFNTGKPVNIGDSTAYINFDGNGHITVVGADFTIGGANNQSGTLTVKDASNSTVGTWSNAGINTIAGTIGPLTITTDRLYSGSLSIGTTTYDSGQGTTVTETILGIETDTDSGENITVSKNGFYARAKILVEHPTDPSRNTYANFPSAAINSFSYTDADGEEWYQGRLQLRTQRGNRYSLLQDLSQIYMTPDDSENEAALNIQTDVGNICFFDTHYTQDPIRLIIKGATAYSYGYTSANPKLEFQNADASENIALVFNDRVQAPASLTLAGNQGGEYFIAPNIKATSNVYANGNVMANDFISGNITLATLFNTSKMSQPSIYQSRLDNMTLYHYTIGSMCFVHGIFRLAVAGWADMAVATGFPTPAFNTSIPLTAANPDSSSHDPVVCYINPQGSLCIHSVLAQYTWVTVSGYYQRNL